MAGTHLSDEPQWQDIPQRRPHSYLFFVGVVVALVGALLLFVPRLTGSTDCTSPESAIEEQPAPEDAPAGQEDAAAEDVDLPVIEAQPVEEAPEQGFSSGDAELDADLEALRPHFAGEGDGALRSAYEYVATNYDYIHEEEYPEGGFDTWGILFAKEMYANGQGNCYRFSSLFCWIARSLGYDATVVQGMVPLSSGLAVHGWCEIHRDGQSFVCDPDLHKFLPDIDLFMVTYDDSRLAYHDLNGVVYTNADRVPA